MAHPTLLRTNTAPVFPGNNLGGISSGIAGARASQLSGSTAFGSSTTLASMSTTMTLVGVPTNNGGPVQATGNIINQKADASRSLYQICVSLRQRLAKVPGFEDYLIELEQQTAKSDGGPVESLWNLLRTGYPLLTIYNCLQPQPPLRVDDAAGNDSKRSKIAIFQFVKACMGTLNIPAAECFVINDLIGNDTTGFVKVRQIPLMTPPLQTRVCPLLSYAKLIWSY
jgi:cell division control protein 24